MPDYEDSLFGTLHYRDQAWHSRHTLDIQPQAMNIEIADRSGGTIDALQVILPKAKSAYHQFVTNLPTIQKRISDYLLPLYNDEWRNDDAPHLSSEAFLKQLYIDSLTFQERGRMSIFYFYDEAKNDLFAGHHPIVVLNAQGEVSDMGL